MPAGTDLTSQGIGWLVVIADDGAGSNGHGDGEHGEEWFLLRSLSPSLRPTTWRDIASSPRAR